MSDNIDIKNLSKLAEMNITLEQEEMLKKYIPQALELCDRLLKIQVPSTISDSITYTHTLSDLRKDDVTEYDQIHGLEIKVPRMVNKT